MAEETIPEDIIEMSFESALQELETIVSALESGQGKLDEAIRFYERGAALKRHCETKLLQAQHRIEKIVLAVNGTPGAETGIIE